MYRRKIVCTERRLYVQEKGCIQNKDCMYRRMYVCTGVRLYVQDKDCM